MAGSRWRVAGGRWQVASSKWQGQSKIQNPKSKIQNISSAQTWHDLLALLPHPHPLQSWAWGEFKARWGWSAGRWAWLNEGGRPQAAALVLKRKTPRLPFAILYVPKGPILDYENGHLRQGVLAWLEQLARQERAIFVKIDPDVAVSWGVEEEQPCATGRAFRQELEGRGWRISNDQVQFRNTVELDLTRPGADLLAAMKQKTRYNIRLAQRKEVVVRPGTPADFPTIVAMYQATAWRDGFAVRPAAYYLDAWQTLYTAGLLQPFLAEYQGQPLAAVLIVHLGSRAIYMYGASTDHERERMPNYLLQWEAIRWAQGQGCHTYDFWGAPDEFVESDPLWGVWRFKAGFNGRVVRHVGAWDYPARPFWYWLYTAVMPRYLDFSRSHPQISQIFAEGAILC
ncbi:MAG: peptidoglycan bridge formation glycyltransferase FemA/FemB family protein [Chloroflexota bacterium]